MKTTLYLTGVALFAAGMVALLLGMNELYAALLICAGSLIGAFSGGWLITKKEQITGLAFMILMSGLLLVNVFAKGGVGSFSGMRTSWIGAPLLIAVVILAVLRVRRIHLQKPKQPL